MNTATTLQMHSADSAATENLAQAIGARLRGSEIIVLSSDLGGGKTTFVRGLARGMGYDGVVNSPTFTISRQYVAAAKGLTLHHFDFYRLAEPGLMSLELAEVIDDSRAVVAIEWANIVEGVLPDDTVYVKIAPKGDTERLFEITYPESRAYVLGEETV